jgi:UDP-N-acetylglucosamine--N-acetylmuramyl-(pentapeptide) pyrophosphoryl-undecaprenol N-acetylglucosamine transferase
MDFVYASADIIISERSSSVSVKYCRKPVIFYSPNVAEDHQTKNAKAIVDKRTFIERI